MGRKLIYFLLCAVAVVMAELSPAYAHHFMDGGVPRFWYEGFLSGLAHPVIGIDHALFVLGVGIFSFWIGRGAFLPLVFIGGTIIGVTMHWNGVAFAHGELMIALSLLLLALLLLGARFWADAHSPLFLLAGVAHGFAYGETIIGSDGAVFVSYMMGFALIQYAMAVMAGSFIHQRPQRRWLMRPYGACVLLFGLFMVMAG